MKKFKIKFLELSSINIEAKDEIEARNKFYEIKPNTDLLEIKEDKLNKAKKKTTIKPKRKKVTFYIKRKGKKKKKKVSFLARR